MKPSYLEVKDARIITISRSTCYSGLDNKINAILECFWHLTAQQYIMFHIYDCFSLNVQGQILLVDKKKRQSHVSLLLSLAEVHADKGSVSICIRLKPQYNELYREYRISETMNQGLPRM